MKNWIPGVLVAITVLLVCAALIVFYLYWSPPPHDDHRGEFLAGIGSFLSIASALFAGLAFAGVCATIPFLLAQANAARDQVQATLEQAKIADQTNRDNTRQGLFLVLSQRLGEVISDPEINRMPPFPPLIIEIGLRDTDYSKETDEEFLAHEATPLRAVKISVHDRFRRQSLFRALNLLISTCGDFQRELFKAALAAQIHDLAARMLIIKSLAEADLETFRIYGNLGMNFEVMNDFPKLSAELTRRFSKKQKSGG